jgi:hypothetical protein
MRKYVSVRMGVVRPVVVAMGMQVSHGALLYYNVTGLRQCHPGGASGLPDRHGNGGCQERERNRDGGPKPDETGRHERDFP